MRKKWSFTTAFGCCAFVYGCASIVEGTNQSVNFDLSPETASCTITDKAGLSIGSVSKTNPRTYLPKSRNDIYAKCSAAGYEDQTAKIESSASGWGVVGCIFIDLCITDYSTGALNKYPEMISISLQPKKAAVSPAVETRP